MTDLRKAAEMALEALESVYGKGKRCETAIKELRQALAQPVDAVNMSQDRVDETVKSEQEPVAVWELEEDGWNTIADSDWMETLPVGTKLYTAPPSIEAAVLSEREACAKVCDEWNTALADKLAERIRAMGKAVDNLPFDRASTPCP